MSDAIAKGRDHRAAATMHTTCDTLQLELPRINPAVQCKQYQYAYCFAQVGRTSLCASACFLVPILVSLPTLVSLPLVTCPLANTGFPATPARGFEHTVQFCFPVQSLLLEHTALQPCGLQDKDSLWIDRLAKVDVQSGALSLWQEPHCYPGEPLFVGTPGGQAEDDGVILSVVLDGAHCVSVEAICVSLKTICHYKWPSKNTG